MYIIQQEVGILVSFLVQDFVEIIFYKNWDRKWMTTQPKKKEEQVFLMVEYTFFLSSHEYSTEVCQPP